jgi:hypothetical protein
MKLPNSQNLLIASLLGLSTLFAGSYPSVKAQSEPKPGCQATVDKILQEIRSKGVKWVEFSVSKGTANSYGTGNPTNRTDVLNIVLSSVDWSMTTRSNPKIESIINNIMGSKILMKSWADRIVANCSNTAIVDFGVYKTDGFVGYYIQSDGKTKLNKCVPAGTPGLLPWGVSHCP